MRLLLPTYRATFCCIRFRGCLPLASFLLVFEDLGLRSPCSQEKSGMWNSGLAAYDRVAE